MVVFQRVDVLSVDLPAVQASGVRTATRPALSLAI
jgi:hypothetical protein